MMRASRDRGRKCVDRMSPSAVVRTEVTPIRFMQRHRRHHCKMPITFPQSVQTAAEVICVVKCFLVEERPGE